MNGVNDGGVRTIRETRKVSPSSSELARLARDYNDDATSPNDESKNGDMANEDKIEPSENTRPLSATRGVKSAPIPPRWALKCTQRSQATLMIQASSEK